MEGIFIALISGIVLIVLLALGVHVAIALLSVSVVGLFSVVGFEGTRAIVASLFYVTSST